MTRADLEARLRAAGIDEAREESMILFCHLTGLSRGFVLSAPSLSFEDGVFEEALLRRERGEPLAYILGVAYFYKEEYEVSPAVLIPRADTERLVEEALLRLPAEGRFADLCTGSGCVAISTLASAPNTVADAYDISPEALEIAKRNAVRNGVEGRVSFFECDLLKTHGAPEKALFPHAPYDLILSNPPYLTAAEMRALDPSVAAEPKIALNGGEDGLAFYRHFLCTFSSLLAPTGAFLFEIGWEQGDALRALGAKHGFAVEIVRDYGGRDRVAVLTRRSE